MKISLKLVLAFVSVAVLCCGQSASSSGVPAKGDTVSLPPIPSAPGQPPANTSTPAQSTPGQPGQGASGQNDAASAAGQTGSQPASVRKTAGQPESPAGSSPAGSSAAGSSPAGSGHKPYIIGPLDVLTIKVWNQPNLSGAVSVGPDGMLSMTLIGEVKADGLTVRQLRDVLTERLKECCVNNPEGEVDVQVGKINSKRYYVYGGVLRGGEFPLDRDTTVMDALSTVGGFKDFANKKKIRIQRGTQEFKFNYNDVSKGKHLEENILLENGDRIFVPE